MDAKIPIIDAHHHLFENGQFDGFSAYLTPEYAADLASINDVIATVYVDCSSHYYEAGPESLRCVGETVFANQIARQNFTAVGGHGICAAIVGHADLLLGEAVDNVLQAHLEAAPYRFRGIRHITAWSNDPTIYSRMGPGTLSSGQFRAGFQRLQHYNLTFDAYLYHPQLPELIEFADKFPSSIIVLDHLGTPLGVGPFKDHRAEIFREWASNIQLLSKCPNVFMKLGGINMPLNGFDWADNAGPVSPDDLVRVTKDYYLHAIDCFSPSRCMFESNFPMDKVTCTYSALWGAFQRIAAPFSFEERVDLFSGTASRVYRPYLP